MTSDSLFIGKAIKLIKKELKLFYGTEEIQQLIFIIFEHLADLSKTDVLTRSNKLIPASRVDQLNCMIYLLKKHMPIEYIVGKTYFYHLNLKITSDVLIPRPETEELVDWIIKTNTFKSPKILDIGTGSGCIAVSLAKNITDSSVDGIDISANAINIAKINANTNNTKVNFYKDDILLLKTVAKNRTYDIIVSNPPYILNREKELMKKNVLDYEPHIALFVPDDNPLIFYEAIINFSIKNLNSKGCIFFEINESLSVEVTSLLNKKGFLNVTIRKDINEKFRFIKAFRYN
jgi:release factor glutamine methyltransferase